MSASQLEPAFLFIMGNEDQGLTGKVVTDSNGGRVRYGINSLANPEALAGGFYSMPNAQALQFAQGIFQNEYWNSMAGDALATGQIVVSKLADLVFNAGPRQGVKLIQRAVNSFRTANLLKVDGICGAGTVAAINTFLDDTDVEALYAGILEQGKVFYQELATENPVEFTPELEAAWLKRLDKLPPS
jgi:lysozyme family protein